MYTKPNIKRSVCSAFLLAFLGLSTVFAQNTQISGKVTDAADNSAMPGVTINIKGSASGAAVTDLNGNFNLTAPNDATLIFKFIGFMNREVAVSGRTRINVSLQSETKNLQEVVVIGYGTQKRGDVTGAVSSVSAAQIEKTPVTTIEQVLQGRTPGVQVTNNDGAPGGTVSVQIRGVGSFGVNEPLYVVDGYPLTGGLSNLNTNDIATMDILKDASATAIYGNRAANGVVIITTKRGRKNGLQVSFDAYGSSQTKPKKINVLNAQQFAGLVVERAVGDGLQPLPEFSNPSALTTIDWQDVMYQSGNRQNYNLSVRGGNEKLQSAISVGYLTQEGVVRFSDYSRLNASLNADYLASNWLKVAGNVKYSRVNTAVKFGTGGQNAGFGVGSLTYLIPTMTGNPATSEAKDANGNYAYPTKTDQYLNSHPNVLADAETQDQNNLTNYFLGNVSLEATLLKGLSVKTSFGLNNSDFFGNYFTPSHDRRSSEVLSFYSQNQNSSFEYVWENTVSYSNTFGIHGIDAVAGISRQENTFRNTGGQGNGSISNEFRDLNKVLTLTNVFGGQQSYALASQFARVNYRLMDKYLFTATVRRDGSSKFAENNRYGVFPSASVAWRIKNENFLKNVSAISDLKIRASYGEVGNQFGIGNFRYLSQYGSGGNSLSYNNNGYPFNKEYQEGLVLIALPNPNLKWETSKQSNIGLDLSTLGGKLSLTADYYTKESSDFLLNINTPAQTGFPNADLNVGSVRNSGIELGIEFRESQKTFNYGINLSFTTVKNEILSFTEGLNAITNIRPLGFATTGQALNNWNIYSISEVGHSIGEFYGFKTAGIFQSQAEIDALNAAATAKAGKEEFYQRPETAPGDRKFQDINNDGKISEADRVRLGSFMPKFFTGLNLDGAYKQFDLNLFWYASVGNKIFNYTARNLQSFGRTDGGIGIQNISQEYYENRWTSSNPSNEYARITRLDQNGNGRPSDVFVEDGSFLRLKNIQLGYTLPASIAQKAAVSKLRFYISAQNLLTFTKYSGLDPELSTPADPTDGTRNVTATGIDVGTYPNTKFFTFGLNASF